MRATCVKLTASIHSIATGSYLDTYHQCALGLHAIWQQGGRPPRFGLAISGGVDSMALAFLCREVVKNNFSDTAPVVDMPNHGRRLPSFSAFIVDHKMRNNSNSEAQQVAAELVRLGIEPHILKLDWQAHGEPSQLTNVETVARRLRYQAMGRACRDRGIGTLLVGHHANDQHETILTRIYGHYMGSGLEGMGTIHNVPECSGIYGVDHSGRPGFHNMRVKSKKLIPIESGGVTIGRPLLSVTKQDLIEVCQENGIKWFEDHTNMDPKLTVRNTFRHLIKHEQLPLAFSRKRAVEAAAKVAKENDRVGAAASKLRMRLKLDLRSGTATFIIPKASEGDENQLDATGHAVVMRRMLHLVSFKSNITLQDLDAAVDLVFGAEDVEKKTPVSIAGVEINHDPSPSAIDPQGRSFTFRRHLPSLLERKTAEITIWPPSQNSSKGKWTEWVLWDGRYWIRVRRPEGDLDPELQIMVKFLRPRSLEVLRGEVSASEKHIINSRLEVAKGSTRFTLPAIVAQKPGAADQIVALPTMNWSAQGWRRNREVADPESWLWVIRYKHVNIGNRHRVLS